MDQPPKQVMVSVGKRNAKKKYSDEFLVFYGKKTKMYVAQEKIFEVNISKENDEENNTGNGTEQSFNFNRRVDKQKQNKVNKVMLQNEILKLDNSLSAKGGVKIIKKNNATNNLAIHQNLIKDKYDEHAITENISEVRDIYRCDTRKGSLLWGKKFLENKSLKHKVKTSLKKLLTKAKFLKCKPYGKSFKERTTLWLHKKKHSNKVKTYKCDLCNREFLVYRWLSDHMQRHSDQKNFPCGLCGKKYMTKGDARMHERRHTKLATFVCSNCDKKFIYQSELKAHLQKHQGIRSNKNIKCEICTKAFATRRDLGRHLTVHTGAKPFKCDMCEKSFSQEINMQVHVKTHTGDKPYHCDVCQKKFIVKSKLIRHQQCHSTPKGLLPRPYQCILCTRKYTAENSLIRHLKIHKSSQETVTKFTSALTKALEDSKKPDSSASAGGVLACLIDQAICDARRMARKTRSNDPPLATIIDQAIHDSAAASSTQTRIEETLTIPIDTQEPSSSPEDSVLKLALDLDDKTISTNIPKDAFTCSYLLKLISEAVCKSNNRMQFAEGAREQLVTPLQLETNSSGVSQTVRNPVSLDINSESALNNSCRKLKHHSIVSLNERVKASPGQVSSNITVPSSSNSEMIFFMASDDTPTITNSNHRLAVTSFNNTFIVYSPPQLSCTHQFSQISPTLPMHHKVQHMVYQNSMSKSAHTNQGVQFKEAGLTSAFENNGAYDNGTIHTQKTGLSPNITRLFKDKQDYLIQPRSDHNFGLILSASSSSKVQPFVVTDSNDQTFLFESTPVPLEHSPQFLLAPEFAAVNEAIEVHGADVKII